jgi:hypothetical protein
MRVLMAFLLVGSALVSGCSGNGSPPADDVDTDPTVPGLPPVVAPGDLPVWSYGQSWKHNWTLRFGGAEQDFPLEVVVTNVTDAGYELATDTLETALFHASFFFPDLGFMAKDLSANTQADYSFPWYNFPLADGKTWQATESNLDFDLQEVTNTLTLTTSAMAVGTPDEHYMVTARDGTGLRAYYDYQPGLGWFSEFRAYQGGEDLENWTIRIVASGMDLDWSGTWYRADADLLLYHINLVVPTAPAAPSPQASFDVTADYTHVQLLMFSFAETGAHDTQVIAPNGDRYQAVVAPVETAPHIPYNEIVQVPAQVGTWQAVTAGASPFVAGGGILAWGATVQQGNV